MEDCYLEISRGTQIVLKVKGSRFIGETCRVGSSDEAAVELEKIRKREYSATHHCYAWQVGLHTEQSFKYSDDGEPNGTAGRPIYDAIAGRNVTNLLLVKLHERLWISPGQGSDCCALPTAFIWSSHATIYFRESFIVSRLW